MYVCFVLDEDVEVGFTLCSDEVDEVGSRNHCDGRVNTRLL